ncbi:MAG: hypothetical protein AAFW95_00285 [Cyanobacteria bacterium J06638_6]
MTDNPETSPEKPKKKIITVGEDRIKKEGGKGGPRQGGKGRRGGRGRDEERKPQTPPALMRGPKPQPKPAVEEVPEEPVAEVAADETVAEETTEPVAEAAAAEADSTPA